jgi:signal transduction histidine kinase
MTAEILDDRHKLEEASRKLMEAEKLATIGRLATALAHEIRNPLTAVKLNIQKIAQHPALNEVEQEQLGIAESGIQQVEKLVKDILSYARAPKLTKARYQLENLLEDAIRFVEEPLEEKRIRIATEFGDVPPIDVDGDQLRQAFLNILLNATEALEHDGTIVVRTLLGSERDEGSAAVVEIEDDGSGIGENDINSIFDPFFTTKSLGTGLGLTNARKVIELHRGEILVESAVGRGTKVTIRLPYGWSEPVVQETREPKETAASIP